MTPSLPGIPFLSLTSDLRVSIFYTPQICSCIIADILLPRYMGGAIYRLKGVYGILKILPFLSVCVLGGGVFHLRRSSIKCYRTLSFCANIYQSLCAAFMCTLCVWLHRCGPVLYNEELKEVKSPDKGLNLCIKFIWRLQNLWARWSTKI